MSELIRPEETQKVEVFVEAAENLVNKQSDVLERASRNKEVMVNGIAFDLCQSVSIKIHQGGIPAFPDLTAPTDESLTSGEWFREHKDTNPELGPDASSFTIQTSESYRTKDGSTGTCTWYIPRRDAPPISTIANSRLLDPFNSSLVEGDDPRYLDKWDKITGWILDQLDESSEVTYTKAWLNYNDAGDGADIKDDRYSLLDVAHLRYLRRSETDDSGVSDSYSVLAWREPDDGKERNVLISLGKGLFKVWTDNGQIDADQYDPELIDRVSNLMRQAA